MDFYLNYNTPSVQASSCTIMVVMSYEEKNPWCKEIKEGIDSELSDRCDINYFYMDTKINFISESIAFAKQLVPSISSVGFISKDSPSGRAIFKQVKNESHSYLARFTDFKLVRTIEEMLLEIEVFKKTSDLLFVGATSGIIDTEGKPLNNKQVTQIVAKAFAKNQ